jgi:hypothetical protein
MPDTGRRCALVKKYARNISGCCGATAAKANAFDDADLEGFVGWACADRTGSDSGLDQRFVVGIDRADGMGRTGFANVGHVNVPVREPNRLPLGSLQRPITSGTHHEWKLCFPSEHGPLPHTQFRW